MKRNFKVSNRSAFSDTELLPLLNFAWDYAWETARAGADPVTRHPRYSKWSVVPAANEKLCVWHVNVVKSIYRRAGWASWREGTVRIRLGVPKKLNVKWPVMETYGRFKDMPEFEIRDWREQIISIAAHEFAHLTGYHGGKESEHWCELTAWDAVDAYRKSDLSARIDAALQNVDKKAEERKAREQAKRAEKNSAQFKLAKIEAQEKVWKRKLALALTKLKKLRRSRSLIVAAHKRKLALPEEFYQKYNLPPENVVDHMPVAPAEEDAKTEVVGV